MEIDDIEKIFERLEKLVIYLPHDAASLGPDYLREQISICRGYLNEVSLIHQRILQDNTRKTIELERLEAEFSIKSDELLTSDRRVTLQPALADRQAMVNNLLLDDRRAISNIRLALQSNGHVEKVVKLRIGELNNTMSALRLQRSLLRDQLKTGSFYGDESYTGRDEDDLAQMSGSDLDAFLSQTEDPDDSLLSTVTDVEGESEEDTSDEEDESEEDESEEDETPGNPEESASEPEENDLTGDVSLGDDDDSLQEALDALVEEEGLDVTPEDKPIKPKGKKDTALPKEKSPLKEEDVDTDMEDFLSQDFEDNLDDILSDI